MSQAGPSSTALQDGARPSERELNTGRAGRSRSRRRREHFDVVFYTPWIGSILSTRRLLPPGGAEVQILMLAQGLVREGLRVAIIVFGEAHDVPREVHGVRIVTRPPYRQKPRLINKLVEVFCVWRSLWQTPSCTVVYRTASLELGLVGIYAKLTRRRLVFSAANVVDFDATKVLGKGRDLVLYKLGVRLADSIVIQTEEQLGLCEAAFGRRAVLIKSIARLAERQDDEPEAFLWVGRLAAYKRPLEYIALARALPGARFRMVGVPEQQDDKEVARAVRAQASEVPNLEFLSPRPHGEVQQLMARAVASVNTADYEGMPNVLLEAWARGVPALVLNHDPGGVVERYGLGGFAGGSMEEFVKLAREQWASRHDREDVAQRCRRYAETNHAEEVVVKRWIEVFSGSRVREADTPLAEAEPSCAA
jgi:glycosyltransferase involved in cell wall biosynthesis